MDEFDYYVHPEDIVEILQRSMLKTYAHMNDHQEMPKFITENLSSGQFSKTDSHGNTAFHLMAWNPTKRHYHPAGRWHEIIGKCHGCPQFHSLRLASAILNKYPLNWNEYDRIIFDQENDRGMTPFMLACASGCDSMIIGFLSLLKNDQSIPISKFIDRDGNNVFHYLMNSSTYYMIRDRAVTVHAMLERLPGSYELINSKNHYGLTPLQLFFKFNSPHWPEVIAVIRVMLERGADPDVKDKNGDTFLCMGIRNLKMVEILLRVGCDPNLVGRFGNTPVSKALNREWLSSKPSVKIVELLLAHGVNLSLEDYLHYDSYQDNPDPGQKIDPELSHALWKVNRSNEMINLKRICRTAIRRQLKWKADKIISDLDCIPVTLISFLLMEDEPTLMDLKDA